MNHRDAEITEVVVVLDDLDDAQTNRVVEQLKSVGLEVSKVNNEESIVEGAIDSTRLGELKKCDSVRYVRNVLTYTVDYPPGDPRDQDGPEDEE